MKKLLTILIVTLFTFNNTQAQLPDGSTAPDFTFNDLNGVAHNLYDYLEDGYTVFVDFSAVWCPPCFGYHQSGALEDLYINHGPAGAPNVSATTTDDVMVIFVEGDGSNIGCLQGSTATCDNSQGTQGDWLTGTPYPIMCTGNDANGNPINTTNPTSSYAITAWPTVYRICPDKLTTSIGQDPDPYAGVSFCAPPAFSCTGNACVNLGVGNGTFYSVNECINNCNIAQTWNCKSGIDGTPGQGDCWNPGDGTGNHTDSLVCEQSCIKRSYVCTQGVSCVDPGDESGTYPTLVGCQAVCEIDESWNCIDGYCEDPGDGSGMYANVNLCISDGCLAPTDIKDIDYINVSVYPNPVSDVLKINGKYSEINIFDLYGKLVLSSSEKNTIDISELSNGIYLVKINNNKAMSINKIIVNH